MRVALVLIACLFWAGNAAASEVADFALKCEFTKYRNTGYSTDDAEYFVPRNQTHIFNGNNVHLGYIRGPIRGDDGKKLKWSIREADSESRIVRNYTYFRSNGKISVTTDFPGYQSMGAVWGSCEEVPYRILTIPTTFSSQYPKCKEDASRFHKCFGRREWSDALYIGNFTDDEPSGLGSYWDFTGRMYHGEWDGMSFTGQGIFLGQDGSVSEGEWLSSKLSGVASKVLPDGSVQEGTWIDGKLSEAKVVNVPQPSASPEGDDTQSSDKSETFVDRSSGDELVQASSGTGFFVDKTGVVVSNNHVISGCTAVTANIDGKTVPSRIIATDEVNDVAILKLDYEPRATFPLSDGSPNLLEDVFVAGYPFGDALSSTVKVTKGIVSSLSGVGNNYSNIQIDAALQPGNSGGPVLNDHGNAIGIAVAKLDTMIAVKAFGAIPEGTNFAVKASVARSMLQAHGIGLAQPNTEPVTTKELGQRIQAATIYLGCMVNRNAIETLKQEKVLFDKFQTP